MRHRYGGDCTAAVIGTGRGTLGLYLLAGDGAVPRWAETPPQCVVDRGQLLAVRSQVRTGHSMHSRVLCLLHAAVLHWCAWYAFPRLHAATQCHPNGSV